MGRKICTALLFSLLFGCETVVSQDASDALSPTDYAHADSDTAAANFEPSLRFIPDPGIRVDLASNAWAKATTEEDGSTLFTLFYRDHSVQGDGPSPERVMTSDDGLTFNTDTSVDYMPHGPQSDPDMIRNDPRAKLMPNEENGGSIWRRFQATAEGLRTETSLDGLSFAKDTGYVYLYHNEGDGYEHDQSSIGYSDVFVAPNDDIIFLYIGDMQPGGYNNVRMAKSTDNGKSFQWVKANVFDDAKRVDEGGHQSCSYVDPKSTYLDNGQIRVFVMTQDCHPTSPGKPTGYIHSFTSQDGIIFEHDEGLRLSPEDFDWDTFGFAVYSLNDPVVVPIEGGRYRMYVTALICEDSDPSQCSPDISGSLREVLVSATTP